MDTVRISLNNTIESRTASTAKDAIITNGYIESSGNTKWLIKRPGTSKLAPLYSIYGTAQGLYQFRGDLYSVIGSFLYRHTLADSYPTLIGPVDTGYMYFNSTITGELVFHNTLRAWVYDVNTNLLSEIVTNFPTHDTPAKVLAPGMGYLDSYTYVMDTDGFIYNSGIEDPTTWNGLWKIGKVSEADGGVALAKHLNYLVAFGKWSSEFFYNAGTATGSPLLRNDTAKCEIGCANGDSVVQFSQTLAFIGQSREAGRGIFLFEGVSPVKVSTPFVERYLNKSNLATVRAMAITFSGHTVYTVTLVDLDVTLVYDLNEKLWYHWSTATPIGGPDSIYYCDPTYMDLDYVETTTVTSASNRFIFQNHCAINGVSYMQDIASGYIVKFDPAVYVDDDGAMPFSARTPLIDGGNNRNKFWHSLEIIADKDTVDLDVQFTDDDYNTWSTARTISLNQPKPIIWQLGVSRRRALQISTTSDRPVRIQELELAVKQGNV